MYPLLVQGVFSNPQGTQRSLKPGATTNAGWSNVIKVGRGDLIAIDPIGTTMGPVDLLSPQGSFSYYIGGQNVIDTGRISNYQIENKPRANEILTVRQPGGQSVKLNFTNNAGAAGLCIHHYFENKFAIPAIVNARQTSTLKSRIKTYSWNFASNTKLNQGAQYAVPTGLGNVVAVEVFAEIDNKDLANMSQCVFSINVGGTSIFEDANFAAFCGLSARPGQIFPILIRPGETFNASADTSDFTAAGQVLTLTLKLYFDDDMTGRKIY